MTIDDPKFKNLCKLLEDYKEFVWENNELRDKMMYYLGRLVTSGTDMSDQDIEDFSKQVNDAINKMAKEKAN